MDKVGSEVLSERAYVPNINGVLKTVKAAVAENQCEFIESRKKNIETLAELGWMMSDVETLIFSLSFKDYLSGPDPDLSDTFRPKNIWTFAKEIEGEAGFIYFKFCVPDLGRVTCISFHRAEKATMFPYRCSGKR